MNRVLLALIIFSTLSFAHTHKGAISHAPIGVMGDHTHKKGEFMMGARYMMMQKKDMLEGTDDIGDNDYTQTMKPREMNMSMVMLGFMYGLTDRLTLVPGLKYISKEMEAYNSMSSMKMENEAKSLGDSRLGVLYDVLPAAHNKVVVAKFALSIPTGDTEVEKNGSRLPYGIQTGSGTYDTTIGITYKQYISNYEIGSQLQYTHRLGENDQGYTLGNVLNASFWGAYAYSKNFSFSSRLNLKYQEKIDGRDKNITTMSSMNLMVDPNNYGGTNVNILLGVNYMMGEAKSTDNRFALEYGIPVLQNVHGKQLKLNHVMVLGWQKLF